MNDKSYQSKINAIYDKHFNEIKLTDSLEEVCGQAGKVYDEIFRLNIDVGKWEDPNKFDHNLSFLIGGRLKSTVQNLSLMKFSEKALARKITNQILEVFRSPLGVIRGLDNYNPPSNYHPDDWAEIQYENEMRMKGLNKLGIPIPKPHKSVVDRFLEGFLSISGDVEDIVISIQDRITYRRQEITVVIDSSKKVIGSVNNSNVLQGENISLTINKYELTLSNVRENDLQNLKNILEQLNLLEKRSHDLKTTSRQKTRTEIDIELEELNRQIGRLCQQTEKNLSQITDYYSLKRALGTV